MLNILIKILRIFKREREKKVCEKCGATVKTEKKNKKKRSKSL